MDIRRPSSDAPLAEKRSAAGEAGRYVAQLRDDAAAGKAADGWQDELRSAISLIQSLDAEITAEELSTGPEAATRAADGPDTRSLGARVVESPGFDEFRSSGAASGAFHEVDIRADITSSTDAEWVPQAPERIVPKLRTRATRVRDLLSVQGTGLSSIPYIREDYATNSTPGGVTAEGAAKTEATIAWTPADATVRKITAWVPVTTEMIEDAPTLRGYIDNRLTNKIDLAEDAQLLSGAGSGSGEIEGITVVSGTQSDATVTTNDIDQLAVAIGKIEAVDGQADGIVMHPTDYWAMVSNRPSANLDGVGGALPFGENVATGLSPWGMPVVRSTAIAQGTAIVGSWKEGATLFDRMRTTVRVGNQHSDYFTTNKVAVLAESRLALAIHRPDLFCIVNLAAV